jgi:hypothetical protein
LAAGKYEELKAAAALAKQSGAISEEQYNGVIDRATKLEELRKQNRALFEESATLNKSA